jgi:hypothetical protein
LTILLSTNFAAYSKGFKALAPAPGPDRCAYPNENVGCSPLVFGGPTVYSTETVCGNQLLEVACFYKFGILSSF